MKNKKIKSKKACALVRKAFKKQEKNFLFKKYINDKVIYKVTNLRNGKVYIGATQDSLYKRKKDHLQKARVNAGQKLQDAICTYGPDAFMWEQIDTSRTSNELAEKETRYILEYNANETGYNSDRGGGIKKDIYQYDLESGNLLKSYPDLESAGNAVNVDKRTISKACIGEIKNCKDYYWSYSLKSNFKPEFDKRKKQVFQFTSNGKFITSYKSVADASRKTFINRSSIAKCCRKEYNFAGDYTWKYK